MAGRLSHKSNIRAWRAVINSGSATSPKFPQPAFTGAGHPAILGRRGSALITSLFRVGLIAAAVVCAWLSLQQPDGERRALDDRNAVLLAGSIAPGSTLSCLDDLAGEVVEAACEKAVFATPVAVAAGVRYVTAQLGLLNDSTAYAQRGNASYAAELTLLRTSIELDRFGLVAHVLSEREGCTADRCARPSQ